MTNTLHDWSQGFGVIQHDFLTRERISDLLEELAAEGICPLDQALTLLKAADRLCNAAMRQVAHMTYARQVYLDGRPLAQRDFKPTPEGHTGGALNMVPAYVGYLLANALTGTTRSWLMGQGHCVAAIDAVNVLMGNTEAAQAERYPFSDAGLSQLCQDFYSYAIDAEGRPAVPLGSHVNPHTGGGISEGGYLGFAGLQYVHMPLPGQELVTFLSDGAFEEQRGSDWAPRWWRGEDSGLVMPIMIANGRRIDQRSTMAQVGGVDWLREHLVLNGFDPIDIDGRDPAAFAWAIINMARSLRRAHEAVVNGDAEYPVRLPYAIAETVKGFGFPGAGTNAAHNLPLVDNPAVNEAARERFNQGIAALHVDEADLRAAVAALSTHSEQQRPQEKDHPLARIQVPTPRLPPIAAEQPAAPMAAIDQWFCALTRANPQLRVRVGNPDEMRSNRMNQTLDQLLHRVTAAEEGIAEGLQGSVITALNEEAVVSAALANRQGINLAVSYEAFAVKMLGAMRQELIFSRHARELGRASGWLSVPIIATSHTWENGKNEQSHQDPTLCDAWLQEMSDSAPVYFPVDSHSAVAVMRKVYASHGKVALIVAPKNPVDACLTVPEADAAAETGFAVLNADPGAELQLLAVGAYQLQAVRQAAQHLRYHGVPCSEVAIIEPGLLREGRDAMEQAVVHSDAELARQIPAARCRLFVCHGHAEVMTGVLRRLDTGPRTSRFLGYRNRGGTLDTFGMQFANRQSWAHLVAEAAQLLNRPLDDLLGKVEQAVLRGEGDPQLLAR
ncbi:xylulose 5-phosphate 3-epimerase [Halopseudomonas aestusnigri]|uniref:Phosphoketolase n=1 Tax=Halopseudomonas aestusnigri TaxID=857252 RepID=A0AAQ1JR57_9GAMM|nr:xylulose 5-phosphate 3-epimerase [Halopseudomonas aestusnigri]OWL85625.1 xylulose 5-phosphate 3-epimerase [Halopseudomonas aestusnigri]SEG62676.1 Phosphoketolase [Halopseudomonas aestusnigri]